MSHLRPPAARADRREGGRHGRPTARTAPSPSEPRLRPQLLRLAVLPPTAVALCAVAAVLFTVRSTGARTGAALYGVLAGASSVALAGIVIAAVAAGRAARSVHVRLDALRDAITRREAELHALVDALRHGGTAPPRTSRGGPPDEADEFELLAADLSRAHDGAVAAVVQAAQLSSQAGSEQKLEVFLNLARRLQSLVHREISILDELENEIEDPDLLKSLFHVDHLATRIRRHAENLAVLGGAVSRRQWSNPVPMTEVLRSAIAEVEQYSRVKLVPPIDGRLRGHAVADVIHLLAELVENATVFSAPHTQVLLRTGLVTSGLAVEVEDRGLGMPVGEQVRMNALLADPDQVNVASLLADGRIGLFVVSQLARRHGITVRLQTNIYGGVQAVLVVPQALLGAEPAAFPETTGGPAQVGPPPAQALPPATGPGGAAPGPPYAPEPSRAGRPPGPSDPVGQVGAPDLTGAVTTPDRTGAAAARHPTGAHGMTRPTTADGAPDPAARFGASGAGGRSGASGPGGVPGAGGVSDAFDPAGSSGAGGLPTGPGPAVRFGASGAGGLFDASASGSAGRFGVSGAAGSSDVMGSSGAGGLFGGPDPAGRSGVSGAAGPADVLGPAGPDGASGPSGAHGPAGPAAGAGLLGTAGADLASGAADASGRLRPVLPSDAAGDLTATSLTAPAGEAGLLARNPAAPPATHSGAPKDGAAGADPRPPDGTRTGGAPAPLPRRGEREGRPNPAEAVPGIRPGDRAAVTAHEGVLPAPRGGVVRGTMERPRLPRRRAQEHIVPQLRDGPAPRQDSEHVAGHDPGLMAAFQRGIGLAEAAQRREPDPPEPPEQPAPGLPERPVGAPAPDLTLRHDGSASAG